VENGSILDLVGEFIKVLGNHIFPAGSVVLIASPAHLGIVGLSAYINDLLWAEAELKIKLEHETIVRPLPMILLPECKDEAPLRDLVDLDGWIEYYYEGDQHQQQPQGGA
jgi:hypothetical protein